MRAVGTFELHVEPETETRLARISLVLIGTMPDERGVIHVTPDCHRLDELEACINALQDELDHARAAARRIFEGVVGHA
jgi:hypothetical protein